MEDGFKYTSFSLFLFTRIHVSAWCGHSSLKKYFAGVLAFKTEKIAMEQRGLDEFQDFLPMMAEKLGEDGFMTELCNGFRLLSDPKSGLITLDSLKKNSALLGLDSLTDSDLRAMVQEGDLDGDGALNEHEFCILMIRLSPSFMAESEKWLENALIHELEEFTQHFKN
eukprot:Gb_30618 [translate_table: standard]